MHVSRQNPVSNAKPRGNNTVRAIYGRAFRVYVTITGRRPFTLGGSLPGSRRGLLAPIEPEQKDESDDNEEEEEDCDINPTTTIPPNDINREIKVYSTKVEDRLSQLLEIDSIFTACIELAECHHLEAWRFDMKFTARTIKGNSGWDQDNLPLLLSIGYRLLLVSLPRDALEGIGTLDKPFAGNTREICFKSEWRRRPVLLAGGWIGLPVICYDEPTAAKSLSEYIALRGKHLRYQSTISFYVLRKRAATDLANSFERRGLESFWIIGLDSRTLEKHFWDMTSTRTCLLRL
ncbi:hypothetical protein MMC17_003810 [Xylographa soralifera]|nr:hypothetical protein [Xylographa soralifera]